MWRPLPPLWKIPFLTAFPCQLFTFVFMDIWPLPTNFTVSPPPPSASSSTVSNTSPTKWLTTNKTVHFYGNKPTVHRCPFHPPICADLEYREWGSLVQRAKPSIVLTVVIDTDIRISSTLWAGRQLNIICNLKFKIIWLLENSQPSFHRQLCEDQHSNRATAWRVAEQPGS